MNGFVKISLKDKSEFSDISKQLGFGKRNSFIYSGKLRALNYLLNLDSVYNPHFFMSTYCKDLVYNKNYFAQYNWSNSETIDVNNISETYYKIKGSEVFENDEEYGCWINFVLFDNDDDNYPVWASKKYDENMIGRVFVHSQDNVMVRTPEIFYDMDHLGSCDSGSYPVINGTFNQSNPYLYAVRIRTTGLTDAVGEYSIIKIPMRTNDIYHSKILNIGPGESELDRNSIVYPNSDTIWMSLNSFGSTTTDKEFVAIKIKEAFCGWGDNQNITLDDLHDEAKLTVPKGILDITLQEEYNLWGTTGGTTNSAVINVSYDSTAILVEDPIKTIQNFYYDDINSSATFVSYVSVDGTASLSELPSDIEFTAIYQNDSNIYVGTSKGYGILKYDIALNEWTQLPDTYIEDYRILPKSIRIDGNDYLYFINSNNDLIKYDLATEVISKTFNTTSSPALNETFTESEFGSCVGNYLVIDSNNDVFICYGKLGGGITKLTSDGNTVTHWNSSNYTIAPGFSSLCTRTSGLKSDDIRSINIDNYGRIVALDLNNYLHIYENNDSGSKHWYYYLVNNYPSPDRQKNISVLSDNTICCFSNINTSSDFDNIWYYSNPIRYGWNGASWAYDNEGKKQIHSSELDIIDGMTIDFPESKNYVINNWFSFAASPGIVKDNLQELTISYCFYTANIEYEVNEDMGIVPGSPHQLTVSAASNPEFLVTEIEERDAWRVYLDGSLATLITDLPVATGYVRVSNDGTLTFHASDAGKSVITSYYWLKQ